MTTVGFFGCCGAARESQFLLGAFFACLLVIFAAEITAGVFAFIGKKAAIQEAQKIYEDIYEEYMKNPGKVNRTIYHYHLALQCCGKDNLEQHVGLPCPEKMQVPKNCLVEIHNVIDANLHLVGIVGIAIAGTTVSKSTLSPFLLVFGPNTPSFTHSSVLLQLVRFLKSETIPTALSVSSLWELVTTAQMDSDDFVSPIHFVSLDKVQRI
uniref:Tetraspanin-2 n=1 Tax=Meleagris gallopavo TaxID=9103 RepID=A0A803XM51_MELGA